jgi:hypothetical protein
MSPTWSLGSVFQAGALLRATGNSFQLSPTPAKAHGARAALLEPLVPVGRSRSFGMLGGPKDN